MVTQGLTAVVFDLFGTLVYELPRSDWDSWLRTVAAVLEADPDAFEAAWSATTIERQTGQLGDIEENLRTVAARAGAWPTDAQLTEALESRAEMYRRWFVPRPGAEVVLGSLRADRRPLALVSQCAPDAPGLWRSSPLAGSVDVEVFSSEIGLRKPHPEIYLRATGELGVPPQACLFVGDGSYGELSGAAAVGMHPVLIRDPDEQEEMLRPEAEEWTGPTIGSLLEVPGLLASSG